MAGSGPAMTRRDLRLEPLLRRALGCLGKFLLHTIALQLRQIVDEQHAIEMIDLVLDAGREQALGVSFMHLAVEIGKSHPSPPLPSHFLILLRALQAGFPAARSFCRGRHAPRSPADSPPGPCRA